MVKVPQQVLNGLEAVRDSGKTNMFDVDAVMRIAYEMEHHATVVWISNNRDAYVDGVFEGFERS